MGKDKSLKNVKLDKKKKKKDKSQEREKLHKKKDKKIEAAITWPDEMSSDEEVQVKSKDKTKTIQIINTEEDLHEAHSDNEEVDQKDGATEPDDHYIEEEVGWSKDDVQTLLANIEKNIPAKDTLKYGSRVEKMDWTQIQFREYSVEECKEKWKLIEKKVRGYRILQEMVSDAKLWVNKPWSSFYNSQKKNRHPDMPKRPLSSYMLFYLEKKKKYGKKNPSLQMTALSKLVANKFNKLPEAKRAVYNERAKALRDDYNKNMKKFLENHPNDSMAVANKNKFLKSGTVSGPPKPLPPIKLYVEEKLKHYDSNSEMSKAEHITQVKEAWKTLSNKKKLPWIRWALEAETKYLEELDLYKSQNPSFEIPKHKSILTKDEVAILERMEGKPEKPPNSAYSLFSRLMLKDEQLRLSNFSPKERMREISRLWAAVSDQEKRQYSAKAKQLVDIYKLEYATYLESLPEDKKQEELARSQTRKKRKLTTTEASGKKMKQIKIEDSFKKLKAVESDDEGSDSDTESEETNDEENEEEEEDVFKDSEKLNELKERLSAIEPVKPSKDPFELFKEIYLTNPGNKVSKARVVWDSMSDKEKSRYKQKLEAQQQNYILKFKSFLAQLKPAELKAYSAMKKTEATSSVLSNSSSDEEDSDNDSSESTSSESEEIVARPKVKVDKKEKSSSSSSDDSD